MFNKKKLIFQNNSAPETMFFVPLINNDTYFYSYDGESWASSTFPTIPSTDTRVVYMKNCNTWIVHTSTTGNSIDVYTSKDLKSWSYVDVFKSANEYGYNYGEYVLWYDEDDEVCVLIGGGMHCYITKNGKDWYFSAAYGEHGLNGVTLDLRPSWSKIGSNSTLFYTTSNADFGYVDNITPYSDPDDSKIFRRLSGLFNGSQSKIRTIESYDYFGNPEVTIITNNGNFDDMGNPLYDLYVASVSTNLDKTLYQEKSNISDAVKIFDQSYQLSTAQYLNGNIIMLLASRINVIVDCLVYNLASREIDRLSWESKTSQCAISTDGNGWNSSTCVKNGLMYFGGGSSALGLNFSIVTTKDGFTENTIYDTGISGVSCLGVFCNSPDKPMIDDSQYSYNLVIDFSGSGTYGTRTVWVTVNGERVIDLNDINISTATKYIKHINYKIDSIEIFTSYSGGGAHGAASSYFNNKYLKSHEWFDIYPDEGIVPVQSSNFGEYRFYIGQNSTDPT